MKILCISDTHKNHSQLHIAEVDMIIHAGDSTNSKGAYNYSEAENFFNWYSSLNIDKKILIAGNHDYSLFQKVFNLEKYDFFYLEQDLYKFNKNLIYGTPYTPEFGEWFFMLNEEKSRIHANNIPPCDILVTHGPSKFILDTVYRGEQHGVKLYEHCGDLNLYHRVNKLKPKLHVFGHIHSSDGNKYPENNGVHFSGDTWFINASCCKDGNMSKIASHGWIVEYDEINKQVIKIYRNEMVTK